ncbi:MAG TPA: CBS domain-containing protein [Acidimicrobiia bacterium]|jgi:CBS domain-containing protein|nr:CBS domain-containing protein [Acidimicrobiia bacterium]
MRLSSLVSGSAEVIGSEASLGEAAERMVEQSVDALVVVSGRNVVGLFTQHDLTAAVAGGADVEDESVAEWMTESPDTFPPDMAVNEAVAWLMETGYRHLPVMGDGELLGIVGIRDLMWALAQD